MVISLAHLCHAMLKENFYFTVRAIECVLLHKRALNYHP